MGTATHRQHVKSTYLVATLAGLLSSSCCVIQLMLNALSISCAGFSILTPYRPIFLLVTLTVIVTTIWKYGLSRATFNYLLIAGMLSASPELVKLYNEGSLVQSSLRGSSGVDLVAFELEITGLSCQACANKVKLHIEKHEGVVGCEVFLEENKAVVRSWPGTFQNEEQLEALLQGAGTRYHGKVIKKYNLSSPIRGTESKIEL